MIYMYILINILYILFSIKFYKAKINPISIYSIMWTVVTFLYELKLVRYYDLTLMTWLIIIVFQLAYNLGCIFGKVKDSNEDNNGQFDSNSNDEKDLKRTIIILSLLTSISTVSNFLIAVKTYGLNLLMHTNQLYAARLSGDIENGIPYLGAFVYPALIYSGVYFEKFGFKKFILLPIILIVLGEIKGAGRLGFVSGAFLLLIPIIFKKNKKVRKNGNKLKIKGKKMQNVKLVFSVSILIIAFVVITKNRSTWISYNPYMSPLMAKLVDYNPSIYKNYTYITAPLGVLNEFLKDPTFSFGGHTFLTIYNFLNKFGADISVSQYQTFYNVPISCNVGTYIRELVEDFTIPLAIMVTFLTGLIFSHNYSKFRNKGLFVNLIWASTFAFVMFFSFFTWHFRSSSMWITLVVGSISGRILDRKYKVILKSGEKS